MGSSVEGSTDELRADTGPVAGSGGDSPVQALLVEDNPGDADLVRANLAEVETFDCELEHRRGLDSALDDFGDGSADVVLLDLGLPDGSPEEVLERAGEQFRESALVVLTGNQRPELEKKALRQGVTEFLRKGWLDERLLEETLRRAVERYRQRRRLRVTRRAVDVADDGVTIFGRRDGEFEIVYCNDGFLSMTGYSSNRTLGESPFFYLCADTDPELIEELENALETGASDSRMVTAVSEDGSRFLDRISLSPVESVPGRTTHFVAFHRDVTADRAETARQLRDQRRELRRYERIVENAAEVMSVKDEEGRYEFVNERFEELVDRPREEIVGKTAEELFGSEVGERTADRLDRVLAEGALVTEKERIGLPEGERTFSVASLPYRVGSEVEGVIEISRDITERERMRRRLEEEALYDTLTGLPNRGLFQDRVEHALDRAARGTDGLAVGFVDLDEFKSINDSLGHDVGDEVLRRVGARLDSGLRPEDTVARIGGDEFTLLLENVDGTDEIDALVDRIETAFEPPFRVEGREVHLSLSVGFCWVSSDLIEDRERDLAVDHLIRHADRAMYEVKEVPGTAWATREAPAPSEPERRNRIERRNRVRGGLERDEFIPFFHPIYALPGGEIRALELLARWAHPEQGVLAPGAFIGLVEEAGLLDEMTERLVERSCRTLDRLAVAAEAEDRLTLNVNLSAEQMQRRDRVLELAERVREETSCAITICFEVTERHLLERLDGVRALRDRGASVAVDDFGTGFSSLSRLKRLPMDELKLDMEFVQGASDSKVDRAIVRTVAELGHQLEVPVVAEGVETRDQLRLVHAAGCNAVQGYCFGTPAPLEHWVDLDVPDAFRELDELGPVEAKSSLGRTSETLEQVSEVEWTE